MAKFSRIMKLNPKFHVISHQGEEYKEEKIEGAGLFEAPHTAAAHFAAVGFASEFADDWDAAKVKHEELNLEKATDPAVGKQPAKK
jgi:hypothetical protein